MRFHCVRLNAYYLRRFPFPQVLRCPKGYDSGSQLISGYGCHLGLTHLTSISCWYRSDARQDDYDYLKLHCCGFKKHQVMTMSVVGGHTQIPVIKQQDTSNLWLLLVKEQKTKEVNESVKMRPNTPYSKMEANKLFLCLHVY